MKSWVCVLAFGLSMAIATAGAEACRIAPRPILPIQGNETAVVATVVSHDQHGARLRFDAVLDGRPDGRTVDVSFGTRPGEVVAHCAPRSPRVQTGDRVVVVLARLDGRQYVRGWMMFADAGQVDDFVALYLGASFAREREGVFRVRWNDSVAPTP